MQSVVLRLVVSGILVFALIGKIQMAPAILRGESILSNPFLLAVAICVEGAAAAWVLVAPAKFAWYVITALFLVLSGFAGFAFFTNRECNCFGNALPSGTTIPINIAILVAMFLCRSCFGVVRENVGSKAKEKVLYFIDPNATLLSRWTVLACIGSMAAATISGIGLNFSLSSQKEIPNIRFLLADDWIGKTWPIGALYNEKLAALSDGKWLVLIMRSDCDHCRALTDLVDGNYDENFVSGGPKIASLVAGDSTWPVHFGEASTLSASTTVITWPSGVEPFVASPAAFLIHDGIIVDAKDNDKAEQLVKRVLGIIEP
jgi:hypothetical protein